MLLSLLPGFSGRTACRCASNISFREDFGLLGARGEETNGVRRLTKDAARFSGERRFQFRATGPFSYKDSTILLRVDVVPAELEVGILC